MQINARRCGPTLYPQGRRRTEPDGLLRMAWQVKLDWGHAYRNVHCFGYVFDLANGSEGCGGDAWNSAGYFGNTRRVSTRNAKSTTAFGKIALTLIVCS